MKLRQSASRTGSSCGEVGEDRLLQQILPSFATKAGVVAGAGDDCAILRAPAGSNLLVLKTDCVVEGVHFRSVADPVDVGWKAMVRPLSDFAAVSAVPQFALVTLIVSAATSTTWVRDLYRGLNRAAARFGVGIVGGETSSTRGPAAISVSIAGFVERNRWVSRQRGKPGDDLFVTGRLGGSIRRKHLRFIPRIKESRWLTEHFQVHAMMDLSDGLGADLPRLAAASGVGFSIEPQRLPLTAGCKVENAISDGEDYELLFAISRRERQRLEKSWRKKFPKLPLTRIGQLSPRSAVSYPQSLRGYIHFH